MAEKETKPLQEDGGESKVGCDESRKSYKAETKHNKAELQEKESYTFSITDVCLSNICLSSCVQLSSCIDKMAR